MIEVKVVDLPLNMNCTFCGKETKRTDKRRNGIYAVVASILLGGFSLYVSHWVVALFDWGVPFGVGIYWVLRKQRYEYHCKHCTTVFNP